MPDTNAFIHLTSLVYLIGHNRIIPLAVFHGVVSGEFADQRRPLATGNGLTSSTAPMILNLCSAGANLASTGEVLPWGYANDPMSFLRRVRGTHVMVATLKRPPRGRRPQLETIQRVCISQWSVVPGKHGDGQRTTDVS